jgi:hypothetical protein
MGSNEQRRLEQSKFAIQKTQLGLQVVQVILSSVLIFFIVRNSLKKETPQERNYIVY